MQIALDQTDGYQNRIQAAQIVAEIGDAQTRLLLMPLAVGEAGDDPDDGLKGAGLRGVWPGIIGSEELFQTITIPRRSNLIGCYFRFLRSHLAEGLSPEDLVIALRWVAGLTANAQDTPLIDLADSILATAVPHVRDGEIRQALVAAVRHCFNLPELLIPRGDSAFFKRLNEDGEGRRHLIRDLSAALSPVEERFFPIHPVRFIHGDDFDWLLDQLSSAQSSSATEILARAACDALNPQDPCQFEKALLVSRTCPALARELRLLTDPIFLDSSEADELRQAYRASQNVDDRTAELSEELEARIAEALVTCENEPRRLPELIHYLRFRPGRNGVTRASEYDPDLTTTWGWQSRDLQTQERITSLAETYVRVGEPENSEWLGSDSYYCSALAGYESLFLMLSVSPDSVSAFDDAIWRKWAAVILTYPLGVDELNDRRNTRLMELAYQRARSEVLEILRTLIRNSAPQFPNPLDRIRPVWDAHMADALRDMLDWPELSTGSFGRILHELLDHDDSAALKYATKFVVSGREHSGADRPRCIAAARELFLHDCSGAWSVLWPAITRDTEFGKELLSQVSAKPDGLERCLRILPLPALSDLFNWLLTNVGFPEGGAWWDSPQVISRSVLGELKRRGTAEACEAIGSAVDRFPQFKTLRYELIEAQQIWRAQAWTPPTPDALWLALAPREPQPQRWVRTVKSRLSQSRIVRPVLPALAVAILVISALISSKKGWEAIQWLWSGLTRIYHSFVGR